MIPQIMGVWLIVDEHQPLGIKIELPLSDARSLAA
jgi:hypothetical protein